MIYNSDYFREEIHKSYLDGNSNRRKLLAVCALMALFAGALNSILNLLSGTVVAELLPSICSKSFYSVATLLNVVILLFFTFYLSRKYNTATFAEINKNRWYMLIKMGYRPQRIIFVKQLTTVIMVLALYSVSFLTAFVFSSLLRYSPAMSSLLPLYLTGLFQTLFLVSFVMTLSLFVKRAGTQALCSLAALAFMLGVSVGTGFFDATNSSAEMTIGNIFTGSAGIYTYLLIGLTAVFIALSVIIAYRKSKFYYTRGGKLQNVCVLDYKTDKAKREPALRRPGFQKAVKITVRSAFLLLFVFGLLANVLIVAMGAVSNNREFSVLGYTPFVFGSSTMSGDVEKNDFVIFKRADSDVSLTEGDVVLYYEDNKSNIRKVVAVNGDTVTVDISSYPEGLEAGSQRIDVPRSKISGVMKYRSRWLGAWFVLNNTVGGRIIMLGIPLIVLAFYDGIAKLFVLLREQLGLTEE